MTILIGTIGAIEKRVTKPTQSTCVLASQPIPRVDLESSEAILEANKLEPCDLFALALISNKLRSIVAFRIAGKIRLKHKNDA